MNNKELIENHTIFHAYLCFLIESDLIDSIEGFCKIGTILDDEILRRNITSREIDSHMMTAALCPEDQLIVGKYIYQKDLINEA